MRVRLRELQPLLADPPPQFGTMTAREFFLYQSQPQKGGSKYTKLERFGLELAPNTSHDLRLYLIVAVVSYLLGSIPFGYLLVRIFRGEDIRQTGSGNIGATNVARSGAKGLGIATLALDAIKGALAVWLAASCWLEIQFLWRRLAIMRILHLPLCV